MKLKLFWIIIYQQTFSDNYSVNNAQSIWISKVKKCHYKYEILIEKFAYCLFRNMWLLFFFIYFRKEYYYFPFTDNNSCNLSFWKSNANINKMHLPKRCLNFLDLSENLRNLAVCLKISAHSRDQALGIMSLLSSWQGMMFSWERNSSPILQMLWHYRVFPHSALGDNMNF